MKMEKYFIVSIWAKIFFILKRLTVFYWLKLEMQQHQCTNRIQDTPTFVEVWVLGHLVLSAIVLIVSSCITVLWLKIFLFSYGALRVFDTVQYQVNAIFFDDYRIKISTSTNKSKDKSTGVWGYLRTAILSLNTYVEIILWYGAFYVFFNGSFQDSSNNHAYLFPAARYSFHVMSTFGTDIFVPVTCFGELLVFSQSIIGLIMVVVIITRFLALIPHPKLKDDNSS